MKHKIISAVFLLIAVIAMAGIGAGAIAGQDHVAYPVRTGTGGIKLPTTGTNGAWQIIATTATNGVVQTTGSGLVVNPGPVLTGTGNVPLPAKVGTVALDAAGSVVVCTGTEGAWALVSSGTN